MGDVKDSAASVATLDASLDALSLSETKDPEHPSFDAADDAEEFETSDLVTTEISAEERTAIRNALNQQTQILYEQFAQEQHPKDHAKQKELVSDMQEQYYNRYINENHQSQLRHQHEQMEQRITSRDWNAGSTDEAAADVEHAALPLIPATIWTRKELADFKQEILKTQRQCCIKIGSLSTATIRVPTHPDGSAIFWEFATDHYDLGFGLYFEWDLEPPTTVSVSISESSDEEEFEEEELLEDGEGTTSTDLSHSAGDIERGGGPSASQFPTDELIPVYRRDCHTEVYCGTHRYPGTGVYVFKFDNSFSLWRSKWLYYRIYYTQ